MKTVIKYYTSEKVINDIDLVDLTGDMDNNSVDRINVDENETNNSQDSFIFDIKGVNSSKKQYCYSHTLSADSILANSLSNSVFYFEKVKTKKYEISVGDIIHLSKRSCDEFVFCGVLKVMAKRRSRRPKFFNLVFNLHGKINFFKFSLCQIEKIKESIKFNFEPVHINSLKYIAKQFTMYGSDVNVPHYTNLGKL